MKNQLLTILGVFLISTSALASYHLNGDYHINDDGTYSIDLQNRVGHYYLGYAEENADGTLDISVQDNNGELYRGTALQIQNGSYALDLQNDATGDPATGTMQRD